MCIGCYVDYDCMLVFCLLGFVLCFFVSIVLVDMLLFVGVVGVCWCDVVVELVLIMLLMVT